MTETAETTERSIDNPRWMEGVAHIEKIREYLNYVERHLENVKQSWKLIQVKCASVHPFFDDWLWDYMNTLIKKHDLSKFSPQEFIQYQRQFYPVGEAPERDNPEFSAAWEHHKENNNHHWEHWTTSVEKTPNQHACECVCMVVDWMAMGLEFGGTAEEYYRANHDKINLPDWAVALINEIFDCLRR